MAGTFPTVTIVIPTFNRSGALKFTLQSVLLQNFSDFETWIVDDGCTDDTGSVVASLGTAG